jgi:hypothetical protein
MTSGSHAGGSDVEKSLIFNLKGTTQLEKAMAGCNSSANRKMSQ